MDLKLHRQPLYISAMLLDETAEQPLECDALLPDYCPDVVRILKCNVSPVISSKHIHGGRINIDGISFVTVYYTSASEGICKAEYKLPFSKSLDIKGDTEKAIATIRATVSYVNCRAINQRRLDIRGALAISVKVRACHKQMVITRGEGAGIELLEEKSNSIYLLGEGHRELRLEETMDIAYGKSPILEILRYNAIPKIIDYKASDGKVIIKGEIDLHIFYRSVSGSYDCMDFNLPMFGMVDIDEVDEACKVKVCAKLTYCNLELVQDSNGDNKMVKIDAVAILNASAECDYQAVTCSDCYSTKGTCTFKSKEYLTVLPVDDIEELVLQKDVVKLPENVKNILELWCEAQSLTMRSDKDGLIAEGRIVVAMFAGMEDGEIYYFDKTIELEHRINCSHENTTTDAEMRILGSSFNFSGNDSIEVRCDISIQGEVFVSTKHTAIDDIVVEDRKDGDVSMPSGLYLYIMSEKEPMWDIAKRYNTSVSRIEEENPSDGELSSSGMLLIPVI